MSSPPDYDQFSEDHQCLLIVVKPIGPQMSQNLFNLIYEKLIQLNELKITNSKILGFERTIRIRYKQSYSIEENDWGDFQAHRKLVGLITVARSFNRNEIESITQLHKTIHDTFTNTLFDSKCFTILDSCGESDISHQNGPETETGADVGLGSDGDGPEKCSDSMTTMDPDDPLSDFDMAGHGLYITSDHTCFTSRVNRSSSSSSLSATSQNSHSSSPTKAGMNAGSNEPESLNYSLPQLVDDTICSGEEVIATGGCSLPCTPNAARIRTHSRNKSLDSKLLSINEKDDSGDQIQLNSGPNPILNAHKRAHSSSSTSLSTGTPIGGPHCDSSSANEFILYESDEQICERIQVKTRNFLTGLFWTLESERLKKKEKKERVPLLMAPCEKKDLVGLDTDTRSFKRKCLGRMLKHIADLSLLVGLPQESCSNYTAAIDNLKHVNDKLWLASAYEGLCAASLVLLFPKRWYHLQQLRQRFTYPKGILMDLLSRNDYEAARSEVCQAMKLIAVEDSHPDPQIVNNKNLMKHVLAIDQFYDRYKEAASNYALYRGAVLLEFECSFKAAKTLTLFRRYLKASDFIQNAVFISLVQSIDEQIERLLRISNLYDMIGFHRKAAFFKRFAALKTVSLQVKSLDWEKCYYLLLPALYSYGLTLDPDEYDRRLESGNANCSAIHVQLLQEIITTSLKMQNETLAIRHLSFMLQCLFNHITASQRQEFAARLSSLASKCGEGSPVPLKLRNGATIPSVNFTKFPTVVYFKIEPLKPALKLYKLKNKLMAEEEAKAEAKNCGPFIYTPLQLNRWPQTGHAAIKPDSAVSKMDFYWAEGNTGCISLSLHNYLPIELNISSIIAMTDGVLYEPKHDTALKIAPNSTCTKISLTGVPRSSGILDILGYRIHTLGIKSDCRLNRLPNAKKLKLPSKFTVEVVPRLPMMTAHCLTDPVTEPAKSIPAHREHWFPDCYIASSNIITLFEGQQCKYKVRLTNTSANADELIDLVNLQVIEPKQRRSINHQPSNLIEIDWDVDEINNQLPFGPNLSIEFEMMISAKGDFIMQKSRPNQLDKNKLHANSEMPTKKLQVLGSKKLANFINELQSRKSSNDLPSLNIQVNHKPAEGGGTEPEDSGFQEPPELDVSQSKIVELCLQFEYSGGPGLNSGFCRRTNIHFAFEIKSSILITHWDVIPAEQMDECYLVLDTFNATKQEINLIYSANKEMLIEPNEKCRIPVPIKRCPLNLNDIDPDCDLDRSEAVQNLPQKRPHAQRSVDFLTHIFPTEQKLEAVLSQCRLHLLRQISLKWMMSNTGMDGIVHLDKVPYSRELLKSLLIPPIQSEVQLNSTLFRSSFGEMNVKLGQPMTIDIRLFNTSQVALHLLRLYLVYYQDFQNVSLTRSRNFNIDHKIVVNGCESLCISELPTKESYLHQCGLVFLYTGVYRLEVCCLPEERFQQLLLENGSLIDDNHLLNNTQQNFSLQMFKCLHTFEITVDE